MGCTSSRDSIEEEKKTHDTKKKVDNPLMKVNKPTPTSQSLNSPGHHVKPYKYPNVSRNPDQKFLEVFDQDVALGEGAYAQVFLCTHKISHDKVAVKRFNKLKADPQTLECLKSEFEISKTLRHPNLVASLDLYDEPMYVYIVMEICTGGELFDRIEKMTISENHIRKICKELLEGIKFLHEHDIVHRDLKPENILMVTKENDCSIKLADFGFAKRGSNLKTTCGTPAYVAPEVITKGRRTSYTNKVDIWSAGVIIFLLLSGDLPFYDQNDARMFKMIRELEPAWHRFGGNETAKKLVMSMLNKDPEKRISADLALMHPWITGEDASRVPMEEIRRKLIRFNAKRKFRKVANTLRVIKRLNALKGPSAN